MDCSTIRSPYCKDFLESIGSYIYQIILNLYMVGGPKFHPITKLFQSGWETLLLQNGEGLMSSGLHSCREKCIKKCENRCKNPPGGLSKMWPCVM